MYLIISLNTCYCRHLTTEPNKQKHTTHGCVCIHIVLNIWQRLKIIYFVKFKNQRKFFVWVGTKMGIIKIILFMKARIKIIGFYFCCCCYRYKGSYSCKLKNKGNNSRWCLINNKKLTNASSEQLQLMDYSTNQLLVTVMYRVISTMLRSRQYLKMLNSHPR